SNPINSVDPTGNTPMPGIDVIIGGLALLIGVALLFTPFAIVGIIIIILALIFLAYCIVEGINWCHEQKDEIQKLYKKGQDSSGLDEDELRGLENTQGLKRSGNMMLRIIGCELEIALWIAIASE